MGYSQSAFYEEAQPRTQQRAARELHWLLEHRKETKPYILAANSVGGLTIGSFLLDYPDEVYGLAFLAAGHPEN